MAERLIDQRVEVVVCARCRNAWSDSDADYCCGYPATHEHRRARGATLAPGSLSEAMMELAEACVESAETGERASLASADWSRKGRHLNSDEWFALQAAKVLYREARVRYTAALARVRKIKGER